MILSEINCSHVCSFYSFVDPGGYEMQASLRYNGQRDARADSTSRKPVLPIPWRINATAIANAEAAVVLVQLWQILLLLLKMLRLLRLLLKIQQLRCCRYKKNCGCCCCCCIEILFRMPSRLPRSISPSRPMPLLSLHVTHFALRHRS